MASLTVVRVLRTNDVRLGGAAFSDDGARLVGIDETGTLLVWNLSDGGERRVVGSQDLSPPARWRDALAMGGPDGALHVFSADTLLEAAAWPGAHRGRVGTPIWSPDGARVAAVVDGTRVVAWDTRSGASTLVHDGTTQVDSLRFVDDGKGVVYGSLTTGELVELDVASGAVRCRVPAHTTTVRVIGPRAIVYGDQAANTVGAVDLATCTATQLFAQALPWTMVTSRDGFRIASFGADATIAMFGPRGEGLRKVKADARAFGLAMSPDGGLVVAYTADRALELWDFATARRTAKIRDVGPGFGTLVSVSDSGFIVTSERENVVRIFDARRGQLAAVLPGAGSWAQLSPGDGDLLYTHGPAGTRVYHVSTVPRLPDTPEAAAAWLDAATTVRIE
jgi:WD40 repeat protein